MWISQDRAIGQNEMDELLSVFMLTTVNIKLDGWCFYNSIKKYFPGATAKEIKMYNTIDRSFPYIERLGF